MKSLADNQIMDNLTWDDEENVLSRSECFSPSAIESDQDKHEALGVEGRPTEEERENNNNWNIFNNNSF